MFTPLCTIHADTSQVTRIPRRGPNGQFFVQVYDIVLQCGLTEMKAQIRWTENVSSDCSLFLQSVTRSLMYVPVQGEEKRSVPAHSKHPEKPKIRLLQRTCYDSV